MSEANAPKGHTLPYPMLSLDKFYMSEALKEARKAAEKDEVPVGAVIVHKGRIIARAHNQIKMLKDPTAHAEMIALTQAAAYLQNERLIDTTVYATIEPCPMCAGAMVLGRVKKLVYGADDPKAGAAGSVMDITHNRKLNHRIDVKKGVMRDECAGILKEFFAAKRSRVKSVMARTVLLVAVISGMLFAATTQAAAGHVEFRLVLSPDELAGKAYDTVQSAVGDIHVWKLYYLGDRDIEKIEALRSKRPGRPLMAGFVFNDEGKKRLYRFTKKFAGRRVAIFVDGKLITAPPIDVPSFLGRRVIVAWPGTESELRLAARKANRKDPSVIALYIEEQGKSNDIAADAWADTYTAVNTYIAKRCEQAGSKASCVEEVRDY